MIQYSDYDNVAYDISPYLYDMVPSNTVRASVIYPSLLNVSNPIMKVG